MTRNRTRLLSSVSVYVDVDVDEVLDEISDDQVKEEYRSRFGVPSLPSFDLVKEIRDELVSGRIHYAIALCESHITQMMVQDSQRQAAFQTEGRA